MSILGNKKLKQQEVASKMQAALAGGKMGLKVKENKKKKDNQGMGF